MLIKGETIVSASKIILIDLVLRETFRLIADSVRQSLYPLSPPKVETAECRFRSGRYFLGKRSLKTLLGRLSGAQQ